MTTKPTIHSTSDLHNDFLTILPRIEAHAQVVFRNVFCCDRKADLIQEAIALSWMWFKRLREKGKNPSEFPSALATYAVRAVSSGRQVCGQKSSRDVFSRLSRQQFIVSLLHERNTFGGTEWEEALQSNTQTPVPEAVAFKFDFPDWLNTLSPRNREIATDMAVGHHTQDIAEEYAISPARVSQLRREFCESWTQFTETSEPVTAI